MTDADIAGATADDQPGFELGGAPASSTASGSGYRVLARKYRPGTFEDLIGQEAMVRTISNSFEAGRVPQAWILTGVRGVGKTTTARILARALNYELPDGSVKGPTIHMPKMGVHCQAIMESRHIDILEMDAASHTGIDDVRQITDGVRYAPSSARYKVYIIDEVHMLSEKAFNAFLKTLEEPPEHAKFVFATTEIRKVPVTVLSRCQRFDLRRVAGETLFTHFDDVSTKEGFVAEPEALRLIARAADGSVRDGLSLLDQAMARSADNQITAAEVQGMLGLADRSTVIDLYAMLTTGQPDGALQRFDAMQAAGADALTVLHDIADLTHLLTRGKVLPQLVSDTTLPEMDRQALQRLLPQHSLAGLTRIWQILMKGIGEVQQALHPAQAAAMVLVRIAYAATLPAPTGSDGNGTQSSGTASTSGNPSAPTPSGSGTKMLRAVGGGAPMVVATPISMPANLPDTAPQPNVISALSLSIAEDYRKLVALFLEKREVSLHAELYGQSQLVSLSAGRLEIVAGARAAANFAGKVGQSLTEWTGDRWIVSLAKQGGQPTLAEQDKTADAERRAAALAHPVVQAVLQRFPQAALKDVSVRVQETTRTTADDSDDAIDTIE